MNVVAIISTYKKVGIGHIDVYQLGHQFYLSSIQSLFVSNI